MSALTLSSDEDVALRKCFQLSFPNGVVIACTLHVTKSVGPKLDSLLGRLPDVRIKVMEVCFGPKGLARCSDIISFDAALQTQRTTECHK